MKIKREELLSILKTASVGLTKKEVLEQSNSFVFTKDELITFNDEILTRSKNPFDFSAVVIADDLIKILTKFPDEEIEIKKKEDEIIIKGKRKSAGIACYSDVFLPFEDVQKPGKWKTIAHDTLKMMVQAARTCGHDESQEQTTLVHVNESLIEACDNFRLFHIKTETGFKSDVLIPAYSIMAMNRLHLIKVSMGKGWVHFLTSDGFTISVRCSHEEYNDISPILKMGKSEEVKLPESLPEMISRAEVMNEGGDESTVQISLEEGQLTIISRKDSGWYKEKKRVKYSGPSIQFDVHPKFLAEILQLTRTVKISDDKLTISVDNLQFVVCLNITK